MSRDIGKVGDLESMRFADILAELLQATKFKHGIAKVQTFQERQAEQKREYPHLSKSKAVPNTGLVVTLEDGSEVLIRVAVVPPFPDMDDEGDQ